MPHRFFNSSRDHRDLCLLRNTTTPPEPTVGFKSLPCTADLDTWVSPQVDMRVIDRIHKTGQNIMIHNNDVLWHNRIHVTKWKMSRAVCAHGCFGVELLEEHLSEAALSLAPPRLPSPLGLPLMKGWMFRCSHSPSLPEPSNGGIACYATPRCRWQI